MAGKKDIQDLSDWELLNELKSLGLKVGPISPTTRRIYEKKLSKVRGYDVVDNTREDRNTRADALADESTKLTNAVTDNCTSRALESPAVFYGVCFDLVRSSSESGLPAPAVFISKEEALKTVKKFKGARFKGFKTRDEAECFSRSRSNEQETSLAVTNSLSASPADPVSKFKGPTPQELIKFRKIIEKGSRDEFLEMVLINPRYLIGPGDTPVILQEGFRYNALHVAVKNNRKEMCQVIIDTLESQSFWNILLNQETESVVNNQRKQFLVDMYLNNPDKGVSICHSIRGHSMDSMAIAKQILMCGDISHHATCCY